MTAQRAYRALAVRREGLTMRMIEPRVRLVSPRLTSPDSRVRLSVRDRVAPERPPRGWRLLRPLPGGYDGIPFAPTSRARTRPHPPRSRLRRRPTGIRCMRGRPIGPRDTDG